MSVDRPSWAPSEVDITRPSVARVYDFYLGGSHNFESDRTFGQTVVEAYPALTTVLRQNRAFLRRAVRHLTEVGVDQFLDLGSGIPTVGNVHEVAQAGSLPSMHPRSTAAIAGLFGDLTLAPPGLVPVPCWRPGPADIIDADEATDDHPMLAGMGRRD